MAKRRSITVVATFGDITADVIRALPEANRRALAEIFAEWLAEIASKRAEEAAAVETEIAA